MHRGTPYIYQGEEIGMTNAGFAKLSQYRDVESLNLYDIRVLEDKLSTHDQMLSALALRSRDNSRTPMQWDSTKYTGFMDAQSHNKPWISVNANCATINVDAQEHDPNSVLAFYRELIRLRHENVVVSAGDWHVLDEEDRRVYAFTRAIEDSGIVVVANLTSSTADVPPQTAGILGLDTLSFPVASEGVGAVDENNVLISTYTPDHTVTSLITGVLQPWEAFAYQL
jgi:oligo-1,6-glucosidase